MSQDPMCPSFSCKPAHSACRRWATASSMASTVTLMSSAHTTVHLLALSQAHYHILIRVCMSSSVCNGAHPAWRRCATASSMASMVTRRYSIMCLASARCQSRAHHLPSDSPDNLPNPLNDTLTCSPGLQKVRDSLQHGQHSDLHVQCAPSPHVAACSCTSALAHITIQPCHSHGSRHMLYPGTCQSRLTVN